MTAVAGVSPDPALVGKRFLEAMITGDHDGLDALSAPDFRMWGAGHLTVSGWKDRETFLGRLRAFGGGRSSTFSNRVRLDLGEVTAQDDRVAIEAEIHAPLVAAGEYNNQFHFLLPRPRRTGRRGEGVHGHVPRLRAHSGGSAGRRAAPSNLTEVTGTYWST